MKVHTGKSRVTVDDSEKVKRLEETVQRLEKQVEELKKPKPEVKPHA